MRCRAFFCAVGLSLTLTIPATAGGPVTAAALHDPGLSGLAKRLPVGGRLRLTAVPLPSGEASAGADLELERFEVFAPEARIVVHGTAGTTTLPAPANAYFRGTIDGLPGSVAFLTVRAAGGVRGLAAHGGEYWLIDGDDGGRRAAGGVEVRRIDAATEFAEKIAGFSCGSDHLATPREIVDTTFARAASASATAASAATSRGAQPSHTARVAIETDFEYWQRFGNATDATDYVGDLIAYTSGIYAAEVDTSMVISSVSLWSSAGDPWTQSNPLCALYEFGRYWNDNLGGNDRTIVHFMSGKNNNAGVAWIGVLCRAAFSTSHDGACPALTPTVDNYGGDYGYSGGLDGNFDINNPSVVWDIVAVSHEIGHNFNSPHTHCYANLGGNASPVDECYSGQCGQSGCYCGSASLPCGQAGAGCGTIMSYCHFRSGGLGNIALTLGEGHPHGVAPERVPARMSAHVASAASSNPSCLAFVPGPSTIFVDGFESGDTSAW